MLMLASTDSLELVTTLAGSVDWTASYVDLNGASMSGGTGTGGNINSATTTTLVSAPTNQRQVKGLTVRNAGTVAHPVTLQRDISAANRTILSATLLPGSSLIYVEGTGFVNFDAAGRIQTAQADSAGISGYTVDFLKVGTAAEAAGVRYCFSKDSGFPGAWAPGTPGLNGRATDGNSAGDAGCITFPDPASGNFFLTGFLAQGGVTGLVGLMDVLWVNSGLVVTTTTAQAITPVAHAARDANGAANGANVQAAILVTTATTNGAAVTNTTMSYTNQDGTAGRTATIASFPATAVIGSLIPFQLAAGDTGVRSIQSVTLGTSYVAGAISVILYRDLAKAGLPVINTGYLAPLDVNAGVRVYPDTTGLLYSQPSATTAQTVVGQATFTNR